MPSAERLKKRGQSSPVSTPSIVLTDPAASSAVSFGYAAGMVPYSVASSMAGLMACTRSATPGPPARTIVFATSIHASEVASRGQATMVKAGGPPRDASSEPSAPASVQWTCVPSASSRLVR